MISALAGRRRARCSGSVVSPRARRIAAAAASASPCASRRSARPGWGSRPYRVRVSIGRLGSREVALQALNLRLLIQRLTRRRRFCARSARSRARRASSSASCQAPSSCMISDAMGMTPAAERHQLGLVVAPARQGVGPLSRAAHVVRLLAAGNHPAVDDTGDDRGQFAGTRREHGFVQQRKTLHDLPRLIRTRPCVCTASANRSASPKRSPAAPLPRRGERRLVPARGLVLHCDRHQEIAALCAVALLTLDEALGPAKPPRRMAHLSAQCEVDTRKKAQRTARSGLPSSSCA